MICEALGVPYSGAKSAAELTDSDRYVAMVMSEARQLYRDGMDKREQRQR